jgi:uncharacterized protein (TIGR02266 family)
MSQDTRKEPRARDNSIVVRYKSATVDEFIEQHSHDVSKGGVFVKTDEPFGPGTLLKFELRLAADKPLVAGVGRVVWKRDPSQASDDRPAGMGVKFIKIDDASRAAIEVVVARAADAGQNFTSQDDAQASPPSVITSAPPLSAIAPRKPVPAPRPVATRLPTPAPRAAPAPTPPVRLASEKPTITGLNAPIAPVAPPPAAPLPSGLTPPPAPARIAPPPSAPTVVAAKPVPAEAKPPQVKPSGQVAAAAPAAPVGPAAEEPKTVRKSLDSLLSEFDVGAVSTTLQEGSAPKDEARNEPRATFAARRPTTAGMGASTPPPPATQPLTPTPPPAGGPSAIGPTPAVGSAHMRTILSAQAVGFDKAPMSPVAPIAEDRPEPTMMKQASALLEEALKEAGGSLEEIGQNPLFERVAQQQQAQKSGLSATLASTGAPVPATPTPAAGRPPMDSADDGETQVQERTLALNRDAVRKEAGTFDKTMPLAAVAPVQPATPLVGTPVMPARASNPPTAGIAPVAQETWRRDAQSGAAPVAATAAAAPKKRSMALPLALLGMGLIVGGVVAGWRSGMFGAPSTQPTAATSATTAAAPPTVSAPPTVAVPTPAEDASAVAAPDAGAALADLPDASAAADAAASRDAGALAVVNPNGGGGRPIVPIGPGPGVPVGPRPDPSAADPVPTSAPTAPATAAPTAAPSTPATAAPTAAPSAPATAAPTPTAAPKPTSTATPVPADDPWR